MANRLDWSKARPKRKPTDTAQTRKLEYRTDRYLEVTDSKPTFQQRSSSQKARKSPR